MAESAIAKRKLELRLRFSLALSGSAKLSTTDPKEVGDEAPRWWCVGLAALSLAQRTGGTEHRQPKKTGIEALPWLGLTDLSLFQAPPSPKEREVEVPCWSCVGLAGTQLNFAMQHQFQGKWQRTPPEDCHTKRWGAVCRLTCFTLA